MTPDQPTGMNELRELQRLVRGAYIAGKNGNTEDELVLIENKVMMVCQEVAREARLDELKPLQVEAQYESDRAERKELHSNVDGVLNMIDERIAELTQKPAKETEGQ